MRDFRGAALQRSISIFMRGGSDVHETGGVAGRQDTENRGKSMGLPWSLQGRRRNLDMAIRLKQFGTYIAAICLEDKELAK